MEANEYVLIIRAEDLESGEKSPVAGEKSKPQVKQSATKEQSGNGLVKVLVAAQKVKPYVMEGVNYYVERVSISSGANEYSARVKSAVSVASGGVDMLMDIATGAAVGGGVGAAVGAAVSIGKSVVQIAMKSAELNLKKQVEGVSLDISRRRAGVSGSRTGL